MGEGLFAKEMPQKPALGLVHLVMSARPGFPCCSWHINVLMVPVHTPYSALSCHRADTCPWLPARSCLCSPPGEGFQRMLVLLPLQRKALAAGGLHVFLPAASLRGRTGEGLTCSQDQNHRCVEWVVRTHGFHSLASFQFLQGTKERVHLGEGWGWGV